MSSELIECPGDVISYNCSIESNSEAVHLTWSVTSGQMIRNITYDTNSGFYIETNLNNFIDTYLTGLESDAYIHSILEVTVNRDIPTDEILIECLIGDLANDSISFIINVSGKSILRY